MIPIRRNADPPHRNLRVSVLRHYRIARCMYVDRVVGVDVFWVGGSVHDFVGVLGTGDGDELPLKSDDQNLTQDSRLITNVLFLRILSAN